MKDLLTNSMLRLCNEIVMISLFSYLGEEEFRKCLKSLPSASTLPQFPITWTERLLADITGFSYFGVLPLAVSFIINIPQCKTRYLYNRTLNVSLIDFSLDTTALNVIWYLPFHAKAIIAQRKSFALLIVSLSIKIHLNCREQCDEYEENLQTNWSIKSVYDFEPYEWFKPQSYISDIVDTNSVMENIQDFYQKNFYSIEDN